jgi:hypothetical protein
MVFPIEAYLNTLVGITTFIGVRVHRMGWRAGKVAADLADLRDRVCHLETAVFGRASEKPKEKTI